jgi:tetratricopeptide (TPR) repeat protein
MAGRHARGSPPVDRTARRPRAWAAALACALTLAGTAAASPARAQIHDAALAQGAAGPSELRELQGWLELRARHQVAAMPLEARLAYRRSLIAWKSGQDAEAVILMRGAGELDPSWAAPQLTLAWWLLGREPSQALLAGAALLHRLRSDFMLQLELLANALFFGLHGLFFGLVAAALIVVGLHQHELRHAWRERLALVVSERGARLWSWGFLLLPWTLGLGLATPALVFLGMLWPALRLRERLVFVGLALMVASAPLAGSLMGRLALPLRNRGEPFHGVSTLDRVADSFARHETLAELATEHRDNPYLHFGLGWAARRAADFAAAEAAYRRTLELWPASDRAHNNLGNLLAMQGRFDEALEHYQRAAALRPRSAAAHFNASQVHTRRFDYRAASDAVARASALDFELVKAYQARSVGGELPLVDQWIAPEEFWKSLLHAPAEQVVPALPAPWRPLIETAGWPWTLGLLALAIGGLTLGLLWQRRMPLRACSSCLRPVCRRCAQRLREVALCPECAGIAAGAESQEFGRVLLTRHRRRVDRTRRLVRAAAAALIPGVGLVARHRLLGGLALLVATVLLVTVWLDVRAPFALPEALRPGGAPSGWGIAACWVLVYAVSLLGAFGGAPEPEAQPLPATPQRARPSPIDRPAEAA